MSPDVPPPVIDAAKLVAFAENDDEITYTGKLSLHVGDPPDMTTVGELPRLVIINPFNNPQDYLLGFCDESWAIAGIIAFDSASAAKSRAERYYTGISGKWTESPYSEDQVRDFLRTEYEVDPDTQWWVVRCSFCGKLLEETTGVLGSDAATICFGCIKRFHGELSSSE